MSYALITGASSGIGYELAKLFAKDKHNIVLIARREERLRRLSRDLENDYKIKTLVIPKDLSQSQSA
jgi:short-subunit dehydrogenase